MWQDIESVLLGDMTLNTTSGYTEIRTASSNHSSFTPTTDDSGGGSMSSVHIPNTNNGTSRRCPQYSQPVSPNFVSQSQTVHQVQPVHKRNNDVNSMRLEMDLGVIYDTNSKPHYNEDSLSVPNVQQSIVNKPQHCHAIFSIHWKKKGNK